MSTRPCAGSWPAATVPLILASVESLGAIYRSVNTYPHLATQGIEGNPERLSDAELADAAREILDGLYRTEIADWHARYRSRLNEDRATTDLARAARAATFGAVASLLVDMDQAVHGTVDEADGGVTLAEAPGCGQLRRRRRGRPPGAGLRRRGAGSARRRDAGARQASGGHPALSALTSDPGRHSGKPGGRCPRPRAARRAAPGNMPARRWLRSPRAVPGCAPVALQSREILPELRDRIGPGFRDSASKTDQNWARIRCQIGLRPTGSYAVGAQRSAKLIVTASKGATATRSEPEKRPISRQAPASRA